MAKSNGNGSSATFDPRVYQSIFGSTFANKDHEALITIGTRQWTKWQLGRIGCPHPSAAVAVQRTIATMRIKTPAELVERASEFGRYAGLGVTAYAVVMALVADCGGDIAAAHGEEVSFGAMHSRALRAMQPTSGDKKTRGPSESPAKGKARRRKV